MSTTNFRSGLGRSMFEIIIGRVIQGSGGAGMVSLVSILITGKYLTCFLRAKY
jgi:hypothetical protein